MEKGRCERVAVEMRKRFKPRRAALLTPAWCLATKMEMRVVLLVIGTNGYSCQASGATDASYTVSYNVSLTKPIVYQTQARM